MLNKLQKTKSQRSDKGFTIIEVMIVLAIAGLILLIVFLAVPALQRSSRNTQRKTDIGRLGAAATTVVANLNGQAITAANFGGNIIATEAGSLGYYLPANVSSAIVSTNNVAPAVTKDKVILVYGFKCNGNDASTAAPRQISILWASETSGPDSPHCLDQ